MLQISGIGNGGQAGGFPVTERAGLERVDPERFAVEDVNHLGAEVGKAKPGEFVGVSSRGQGTQVVEHKSETGVRPVVQFANAGEGEQGSRPPQESGSMLVDSGANDNHSVGRSRWFAGSDSETPIKNRFAGLPAQFDCRRFLRFEDR
jgi:hypothetical protein